MVLAYFFSALQLTLVYFTEEGDTVHSKVEAEQETSISAVKPINGVRCFEWVASREVAGQYKIQKSAFL